MTAPDFEIFEAGEIALQSGATLPRVRLAYQTLGTLSPARDNVVLIPTYYTGSHRECAQMAKPGRALDPGRHFIVIVNMLGNGISTSPSNTPAPHGGAGFPVVTVLDNVHLQHQLLTERLGIETVALVAGWSMGAQQAFQWGASYPGMVRAILPICGSARTSIHNYVFLQGVKAALVTDPEWADGHYRSAPRRGLEAFGRVYAGWAYSQAFFREGLYRDLGFDTADALLDDWARDHAAWDANNLLAMLATWEVADISANDTFGGDFDRALAAIEARAIVMPGATDLYFPPADSGYEVSRMPNAELRIIDSLWGHLAGSPIRDPASDAVIDAAIRDLLNG